MAGSESQMAAVKVYVWCFCRMSCREVNLIVLHTYARVLPHTPQPFGLKTTQHSPLHPLWRLDGFGVQRPSFRATASVWASGI